MTGTGVSCYTCSVRPLLRTAGSAVLEGFEFVALVSCSRMQDGDRVGSIFIKA